MAELIWEGKYDAQGRRVEPGRVAAPLQTIEVVEGGEAEGAESEGSGAWRNRLIWGDTAQTLPTLLAEFAGTVNLIYIDPPFATGGDFTTQASLPTLDGVDDAPERVQRLAYRDTWGGSRDAYLRWFAATATLLRELLCETGSVYVHCDWRMNAWIRLILDETFGPECFLNEIAWLYGLGGSSSRRWPRKHDNILWYARTPDAHYFEAARIPATSQRLRGQEKKAPDYWDIPALNNMADERLDYPTQKPEALLERIIASSSRPGDVILDCCCGSGGTPAGAERLGRRWIACDSGRLAIQTTRKRLLALPSVRPFVIQTCGVAEEAAGEPGTLEAQVNYVERDPLRVTVTLAGFAATLSPSPSPTGRGEKDVGWERWIESWAVDWDARGEVFHTMAWAARTRREPRLPLRLSHSYGQSGAYSIAIRIVDILGGETTLRLTADG